MFGAVNANQEQFVFDGESGDVVPIDAHILPPLEKFFDWKAAREITHGALGMEFNEEWRCHSNEKILPRNVLCAECLDRNFRLITSGSHKLGGAQDVFLADENVEIAILSCPSVAVSA